MDLIKKEIHSINRILEHWGDEIKIAVVVTVSIDGMGRRYESKGKWLLNNVSKKTIQQALTEEAQYIINFLKALGFSENYVTNEMNQFLEMEINK